MFTINTLLLQGLGRGNPKRPIFRCSATEFKKIFPMHKGAVDLEPGEVSGAERPGRGGADELATVI